MFNFLEILPRGIWTALATPFKRGQLDLQSFRRLVKFQLDGGVQALVVNGTTAESPTLALEEVETLFKVAREIAGSSFPLWLGTGSNCTRKTIEMTQLAKAWGADGAMIVTPYYNKPPQRGLIAHYSEIAHSVQIPILLYNVPSRTNVNMGVETIVELSRAKGIVGVKEASGDLSVLDRLKPLVNQDFALLSGDDDTCIRFIGRGGRGVVSVLSHLVPRQMVQFADQALRGLPEAEAQFQRSLGPLCRAMYSEVNPIGVKVGLQALGIFESSEMRLPLVEAEAKTREQIMKALEELS